jgi:spermidine/putrescine transport system permease protein
MKDFIIRSLESLSSFGYIVLILAGTYAGWRWGAGEGHAFLGLIGGFVLGLVAATVVFGLVLLAIGIHRNTGHLLLVQRLGPERAEASLRTARAATGFLGLSSGQIIRLGTNVYLVIFFAYMFLPLIFMMMAAFNSPTIPTAFPIRDLTLDWFGALLGNTQLWEAALNSVIIGVGVICLTVPLGLAGALVLTRLHSRARTVIYAILVSPLLTPGIILGISTLVFWNSFGVPGGLFLAIIAQSSFISAFAMLLFMARLQRFDPALEEAALDLGASHQQVFWKITVPFLRPTILTAAVLAFLQSFENFNTTVFAIGPESTLTIQIASMVRLGLSPEVNALAVIFIVATVTIAIAYELKRRAEKARAEVQKELARAADARIALEETVEGRGDTPSPQPATQPANA